MESVVQNKSCVHSVLFVGDHGGSTLLPPNVTNEFPEYGTMEESGEGLRASLEFDAESLPCCPQVQQRVQSLAGHPSGLLSVTGGPKDVREVPSQSHLKEQSLQPIDSLISALKATEARIVSGTLQATKVYRKKKKKKGSVRATTLDPFGLTSQAQKAMVRPKCGCAPGDQQCFSAPPGGGGAFPPAGVWARSYCGRVSLQSFYAHIR